MKAAGRRERHDAREDHRPEQRRRPERGGRDQQRAQRASAAVISQPARPISGVAGPAARPRAVARERDRDEQRREQHDDEHAQVLHERDEPVVAAEVARHATMPDAPPAIMPSAAVARSRSVMRARSDPGGEAQARVAALTEQHRQPGRRPPTARTTGGRRRASRRSPPGRRRSRPGIAGRSGRDQRRPAEQQRAEQVRRRHAERAERRPAAPVAAASATHGGRARIAAQRHPPPSRPQAEPPGRGAPTRHRPRRHRRVLALERELGVSHVLAQVLVRRGFGDPAAARAWLGGRRAPRGRAVRRDRGRVDLILMHVEARHAGSRSTATTTSTASARRRSSSASCARLGADVDWFLPSRAEDGYGLSPRPSSASPRAGRSCSSPPTARSPRSTRSPRRAPPGSTSSSPTTTRRAPTARCPTRRSSIRPSAAIRARTSAPPASPTSSPPRCSQLPAQDPGRGRRRPRPRRARDDRRLRAAARREPPPRARGPARARHDEAAGPARADEGVARRTRARIDARAVGFRLAPRINAAGRLERADAGLELLLTHDEARAAQIADELDRLNAERRHTEQRILFEAEAQVAQLGDAAARTSSRARAGTRASSGSSRRGSPSVTTARRC